MDKTYENKQREVVKMACLRGTEGCACAVDGGRGRREPKLPEDRKIKMIYFWRESSNCEVFGGNSKVLCIAGPR